MVEIDNTVYMTFTAFDGWGFLRMALSSLPLPDFLGHRFGWTVPVFLSPPGELHKNWVLFPEKIRGRYAILHSLAPKLSIEYVDDLSEFEDENRFISSDYQRDKGRPDSWDKWVRGAGAPPLKNRVGWLLL
jgi:predicted GH43/DUF377 family glycosyl hydrolase